MVAHCSFTFARPGSRKGGCQEWFQHSISQYMSCFCESLQREAGDISALQHVRPKNTLDSLPDNETCCGHTLVGGKRFQRQVQILNMSDWCGASDKSMTILAMQSQGIVICLSFYLSIHPSVHPSIFPSRSIYPSIYVSRYWCIHMRANTKASTSIYIERPKFKSWSGSFFS